MNKLNELELEEAQDTVEAVEVGGRFIIEDLDSANWAFRKLRAIEEKEQEVKELAKREIYRINEWKETELKATEDSKGFFESLLMEYYIKQKESNDKFKLSTPYGKVTSRKQQPKFTRNEEELLKWTKENKPNFVKIKESANWTELKKNIVVKDNLVITEDGEIVEGVTATERPDNIKIKVEK